MDKLKPLWPLLFAGLAAFIFFWLPNWGSAAVILAACGVLLLLKRRTRRRNADAIISESVLPPAKYSGWVVLVCGGKTGLFTAEEVYRETEKGWYLAVNAPENLVPTAVQLAASRPELVSRLTILLALFPERYQEKEAFTHELNEWRHAIAACAEKLPVSPPLTIGSWLASPHGKTAGQPGWFTLSAGQRQIHYCEPDGRPLPLARWQEAASQSEREMRIHQLLWLDSLLAWNKQEVESVIGQPTAMLKPCAYGWNFTSPGGVERNLWQQHLVALDTLPATVCAIQTPLPLPDCLLAQLPPPRAATTAMQGWRAATLTGAVFLLLALLTSWHHNRQLLQRVGEHLTLYYGLSDEPPEPKRKAQAQLEADLAQLEAWQHHGRPLRYGLGLYQGGKLLKPLRAALEKRTPPVSAKPPAEPAPQAQTLRLEGLSLFASGEWRLRPDSTGMLVNVLLDIKTRPGWLILIEGHTDGRGSAEANRLLSLRRAEAVRDWLRDYGGLAESCFAVEGHGVERPLKSNDTEAGRAANRRVEIRLIPQAEGCRQPTARSGDGVSG